MFTYDSFELLIVFIIGGTACWYLFRKIKANFKSDSCNSCKGCHQEITQIEIRKK